MRTAVLAALILLAGCQSDAERLADLRYLESYHRLSVQRYERMYEDALDRWEATGFSQDSMRAWTDSLTVPYRMHRDSLDLVQRDINRLLR